MLTSSSRSKLFALFSVLLVIVSAGVQTTSASESISAKNQAILDRALERYVYAPVAEKNIFQKISILETRLAFMEKKLQNPNLSKSANSSIEYIVTSISTKIAYLRTKTPLYANQEEFKKDLESKIDNAGSGFKQQVASALDTFYNQQLSQGKYELFYASTFARPDYRFLGINNAKDFATAMRLFSPTMQVSMIPDKIILSKPKDGDYIARDGMTGAILSVGNVTSCTYSDETLQSPADCAKLDTLKILYAMDGNFYTVDTLFPFQPHVITKKQGSTGGYDVLLTSHPSSKGAYFGIITDVTKDEKFGRCFGGGGAYCVGNRYAVTITDSATGNGVFSNTSLAQLDALNNMAFIVVPGLVRGKKYTLMITQRNSPKDMYFSGDFVY